MIRLFSQYLNMIGQVQSKHIQTYVMLNKYAKISVQLLQHVQVT